MGLKTLYRCPEQATPAWATHQLQIVDTAAGLHVSGPLRHLDGRVRTVDVVLPWPPEPPPDTWDQWKLTLDPETATLALVVQHEPGHEWVAVGWRVTGAPRHDSGHIIDNIPPDVGFILPRRHWRVDEPPPPHVAVHSHGAIDVYEAPHYRRRRIQEALAPETLTRR
jgi:hypothetical protein